MRIGVAFVAVLAFAFPANAFALTRADRAAIDRTLDAFIPTAVARKHVAASYGLTTPSLRQPDDPRSSTTIVPRLPIGVRAQTNTFFARGKATNGKRNAVSAGFGRSLGSDGPRKKRPD